MHIGTMKFDIFGIERCSLFGVRGFTVLFLSLSSGGCGRTGTYIAVSILIERLKTEGVVDVFQTVRKLRMQRPGMVASPVSSVATMKPENGGALYLEASGRKMFLCIL